MNGPISKGVSSAFPRVFSRRSAILKIVEEKALRTRLTHGFPFLSHDAYGAPLGGPSGSRSSAITGMYVYMYVIKKKRLVITGRKEFCSQRNYKTLMHRNAAGNTVVNLKTSYYYASYSDCRFTPLITTGKCYAFIIECSKITAKSLWVWSNLVLEIVTYPAYLAYL